MKIRDLKNLKKEAKNLDIKEIDIDSFWESLLLCLPTIKQFCKHINKEMDNITSFSYTSCLGAMDQYDRIVDNIVIKSQLIHLYKTIVKWYVKLNDKEKQCYKEYVIRGHGKIDNVINGRPVKRLFCRRNNKIMKQLIPSFKNNIEAAFDYDAKELIKNPFIYKLYNKVVYKKDNYYGNRGGVEHDNSTNERCYC